MNNSEQVIEKRNYRVPEFIRTYGIGRTMFYGEVKAGRLRIFKVGKITLISREAAEAWQALRESGSI